MKDKKLFLLLTLLWIPLLGIVANTAESKEGEVKEITQDEFKKLVFDYEKPLAQWRYGGKQLIIVDFYADWCAPCRKLSPILKELANEYKGKIIIYKIDVDQNKKIAEAFGIQTIPTMLFVPRLDKPTMIKGLRSKVDLKKMIDTLLLEKAVQ